MKYTEINWRFLVREFLSYAVKRDFHYTMPKVSERDPVPARIQGTTKSFAARQMVRQERVERKLQCYFCKGNHVAGKCDKVSSVEERRKILKEDKRCFNCLKRDIFRLNTAMAMAVVNAKATRVDIIIPYASENHQTSSQQKRMKAQSLPQ